MKYILSSDIALRSWKLVPYAYYRKGERFASGLSGDEFEYLLRCDGVHDSEVCPLSGDLERRGFIKPALPGDALTPWQRHLDYGNRYVPLMNLQITAKCNYNCIHCFNATDNAPLLSEMSYDDVCALLSDAAACGVSAVLITGGEPMAHKRFMDIIREVYRLGMFVFELNTNGYYLDQTVLDEFKSIGCRPLIKISFDGLGYHDWMRGRTGAEEDALRAIRLCVDNAFGVMVQYNINRKNRPTIEESLDFLDSMGVASVRLIRTTPAPRWEKNAAGQTFSMKEYYDVTVDVMRKYASGEHNASLDFWETATYFPRSRSYAVYAVRPTEESFKASRPICKGCRGMIAVGAEGTVYPCLQMSGWFDEKGIDLGNVFRDGLRGILSSGSWLSCVTQTVGDRIARNGKCGSCRYVEYCFGGCPALAILGDENGSILAPDPSKCLFYDGGYYKKFAEALPGCRCLTELPADMR